MAGHCRALELAERQPVARTGRSRVEARRNREGEGGGGFLQLQDQMIGARAVLLAALLVAAASVRAQPLDASDVAPPLRAAVLAYRAGDLATAEASLRRLAPRDADAEAWLGAVLLDRGHTREAV